MVRFSVDILKFIIRLRKWYVLSGSSMSRKSDDVKFDSAVILRLLFSNILINSFLLRFASGPDVAGKILEMNLWPDADIGINF